MAAVGLITIIKKIVCSLGRNDQKAVEGRRHTVPSMLPVYIERTLLAGRQEGQRTRNTIRAGWYGTFSGPSASGSSDGLKQAISSTMLLLE